MVWLASRCADFFMKKLLPILLLSVVSAGGWYALSHRAAFSTNPQTSEADSLVARVEARNIDSTVEISGDVTPAFQLDVKPEVGGKLKALHVEPGDIVKEGDVLVEVDDRDLLSEMDSANTEIEGAKLTVDRSKRNFERSKELFEAKLVSREAFDNLASEFAIAENGLTRAERKLQLVADKLRKTKVLSPMNGTVLTVPVIEGQVVIAAASVNSGTTLMTIADLTKLQVETHVNQVDVVRIQQDQVVKLRAESLKDSEMEARIFRIAQIATPKNSVKGFQVLALIDKPNARLRPGMTVNVVIPIASADNAMSVPISAVFRGEGRNKVVYVRNGEVTEKREVTIGVTNTDFAQVISGLEIGEEIMLVEPHRVAQKKS